MASSITDNTTPANKTATASASIDSCAPKKIPAAAVNFISPQPMLPLDKKDTVKSIALAETTPIRLSNILSE